MENAKNIILPGMETDYKASELMDKMSYMNISMMTKAGEPRKFTIQILLIIIPTEEN